MFLLSECNMDSLQIRQELLRLKSERDQANIHYSDYCRGYMIKAFLLDDAIKLIEKMLKTGE